MRLLERTTDGAAKRNERVPSVFMTGALATVDIFTTTHILKWESIIRGLAVMFSTIHHFDWIYSQTPDEVLISKKDLLINAK